MARLQAEPRRFTFDAAVRILSFLRRRADAAEAARFTSVAGSSFLGAEVTDVKIVPGTPEARVTAGLIGLSGPVGVMPRQYSDAVVADQRARSYSLTDFLDLISHRMVAAFAAAGAKYRPQRTADTGALASGRQKGDRIAGVLLGLTGYATPHLDDRSDAAPASRRSSRRGVA